MLQMKRWISRILPTMGALTIVGSGLTPVRSTSAEYPYSVVVPSSYRYLVIKDTENRNIDYYFPSVGSTVTNVHIYATRGLPNQSQGSYMRGEGGRSVHRVGVLSVAGQHLPIMHAEFQGLNSKWGIDQVTFVAHGMFWRLTASYDRKYRNMRPTMIRILESFRLRS